jgi:hypothetical protein
MLTAERVLALLVSLWLLGCCGSGTLAATYHVGKGQRFATMQDLLSAVALVDHDVVLVHPGTYPPFVVERGGGSSPETAPVIRASDVTRRPVFDAAGAKVGIALNPDHGKWFALDGLEVCRASDRGIRHAWSGLVMRHCYVHDCRTGFLSAGRNVTDEEPGYLIAESNEFARNGQGVYCHQWYIQEYWVQFRYNWVHDATGGLAYKDRSRTSLVEYNLIEQGPAGHAALYFCGFDLEGMPDIGQTATAIGNIICNRGEGRKYQFVSNIRKEGGVPGGRNIGKLYLINNTFYSEGHTGPMLATDEGSRIWAYNNIFQSTASDRILGKVEIAENAGEIVEGRHNWVNRRMVVPDTFKDTISGSDSGFMDVTGPRWDLHLRSGSPCIAAGWDAVSPRPTGEYRHPMSSAVRRDAGILDIGAFAYKETGR